MVPQPAGMGTTLGVREEICEPTLEAVRIKAVLAFIVPAPSLPSPSGPQGGVWGFVLTTRCRSRPCAAGAPPCTQGAVTGQGLLPSALQRCRTRAEPLHGSPLAIAALCCRGSLDARGELAAAMQWGGHAGCIIWELLVLQAAPHPPPFFSPPRPSLHNRINTVQPGSSLPTPPLSQSVSSCCSAVAFPPSPHPWPRPQRITAAPIPSPGPGTLSPTGRSDLPSPNTNGGDL